MRKIVSLTLAVCLLFLLSACSGVARFAAVRIGESERFTKDELEAAVQVVRSYMETGLGSINGVSADNVTVLFTDFITGGKDGTWTVDDCGY